MKSNMNIQKGFTLIELVIVVVLLAILASVALPRFLDITDSAHEANVSGTSGALGSAISISHAKWLASGQPTSAAPIAGLDITRSSHADTGFSIIGWPNAATDGSRDIAKDDVLDQGGNDAQICANIATNLLSSSSVAFGAKNNCAQDYCATYEKPNCIYTYQQDLSKPRRILYNTITGQVKKDTP